MFHVEQSHLSLAYASPDKPVSAPSPGDELFHVEQLLSSTTPSASCPPESLPLRTATGPPSLGHLSVRTTSFEFFHMEQLSLQGCTATSFWRVFMYESYPGPRRMPDNSFRYVAGVRSLCAAAALSAQSCRSVPILFHVEQFCAISLGDTGISPAAAIVLSEKYGRGLSSPGEGVH